METQADFGPSLKQAIDDAGRTIQALADHLELPHSTVSTWISRNRPPEPATVFEVERWLGLPPGRLSRALGYLPAEAAPAVTVLEAIDADPKLTEMGRAVLRAAYEELVR